MAKVINSIKVMMVMCEHSNYVLQITNLMRMARIFGSVDSQDAVIVRKR